MSQPARVGFRNLRVHCIIGVLPHEREAPQDLFIDLDAATDIADAADTDDVRHAVDYAALAEVASRVAVEGRFLLAERLVVAIADAVLARWPAVSAVTIECRKPAAIPAAAAAVVAVTRRRSPAP